MIASPPDLVLADGRRWIAITGRTDSSGRWMSRQIIAVWWLQFGGVN